MPYLTGVRQHRIALGVRRGVVLKVGVLAEELGISAPHMTSVENGHRSASPELTALLASKFGVSVEELTVTVPDRPPPQPTGDPKGPPKRDEDNKAPKREGEAA